MHIPVLFAGPVNLDLPAWVYVLIVLIAAVPVIALTIVAIQVFRRLPSSYPGRTLVLYAMVIATPLIAITAGVLAFQHNHGQVLYLLFYPAGAILALEGSLVVIATQLARHPAPVAYDATVVQPDNQPH